MAMMKSLDEVILRRLLISNFMNVLAICIESQCVDAVGLCLMTVIYMIEASQRCGRESEVRAMLGDEANLARLENLGGSEDGLAFENYAGILMPIPAMASHILDFFHSPG
jgi:hypothetical protein